ncbi:response regulator [Ramlibacter sp. G-1-2-2]|uniref:histidine kinase n=1 Tax=Ramlibacter agri TaxID=2728837 RepID=A0A848HDS4_9BURK|nr:hybrid sensor histidine kinase/response regulator [Ramlibacter agri]NML48322.1 response regulator [Ramlibacter agri]
MKRLVTDLMRRYRAHHAGNGGLLQGIGIVGTVAFPGIYLLRFTGRLPPLWDDLHWRLVATVLCFGLATRKYWPQKLQPYYLGYSWFAVFYSLAFLLPLTLLQNNASTPSVANMVVSVVLIILLTDWRNTIIMLVAGYMSSIAVYWLMMPDPVLPSSFLLWWVPLSAVLVASGSISKYVEKRAELVRMRRLYSGMAGSVAHEMRTPLSQVQHALDTIEASLRRNTSRNGAVLTREDLAQLLNLTAQGKRSVGRGLQAITLTLQQLSERAVDTSHYTRLSAAACVQKAVDEYAYEGAQQRSRVRLDVLDDFVFIGDETAVVLIVFNLLKNALYYLPLHPEATITITVDAGPEHRIVVRDTGPGIPPEVVGGLFEEFQSAGKVEGTGLGLAFSRRAMRACGGDIACRSELGQFTEFTLRFPPAPAGAEAAPAAAPEPAARPALDLAGRTVLVVDDSAFNRTIVKARLGELGVHAIEAQHGGEALRMIDEGARPAAILMDMQMPGLSGVEATRALRSRPAPANAIPVLGLSANDLPSWREGALEVGMNGYLTKPVQPDLLREELERVLNAPEHAAAP